MRLEDVESHAIATDNIIIDNDGNRYDQGNFEQVGGCWYYNKRPVLINELGKFVGLKRSLSSTRDGWDIDDSEHPLAEKGPANSSHPSGRLCARICQSGSCEASHKRRRLMHELSFDDTADETAFPTACRSAFDLNHSAIFTRVQRHVSYDLHHPGGQRVPQDTYYGYRAEELIDSVAMHCQPCRASNLTSLVTLKIFRKANFHHVPYSIFCAMSSAIALAENLILRGSLLFWIDLACGRRRYSMEGQEGLLQERLQPVTSKDERHLHLALKQLQALGEVVSFGFDTIQGGYARSRPSDHPGQTVVNEWKRRHEIHLDAELYRVFERYSRVEHVDTAAKLRFDFFVAVLLCHEIAHAFEIKCGNAQYFEFLCQQPLGVWPARRIYEARWEGQKYAEAGANWEVYTFGGRIKPINHGCDPHYGLVIFNGNWFDCSRFGDDADVRTSRDIANSRVISMGYIEEVQQEKYWLQPGPRKMHPPKFGPSNLFTNTDTSTVSWRQYLLGREQYDSDNTDQPLLSVFVAQKQFRSSTVPMRTSTSEQSYETPDLDQKNIHEYFHYPGSPSTTASHDSDIRHDCSNPVYDALLIPSDSLRLADKWLLLEELFCLEYNISSAVFLAHRQTNELNLPIDSPYHPHNPDSWSSKQMNIVRRLREQNPDRAFPVLAMKRRVARAENKERWRIINEMEELSVYLGHSRIDFEKEFAKGHALLLGMTVESFDKDFSALLKTKRKEYCDAMLDPRTRTLIHVTKPSSGHDATTDEHEDTPNTNKNDAAQTNTLDDWLANNRMSLWLQELQNTRSNAEMSLDPQIVATDAASTDLLARPDAEMGLAPSPQAAATRHDSRARTRKRRRTAISPTSNILSTDEYKRLQKAAAHGHAGLYSYLRTLT